MPIIYERLAAFNKDRLPEMVKLKYKLMSANVFSFYRGTCHLFYEDLAAADPLPPSPVTWICGDLHLENFGSFKGDNREEYFDLNDFDEALLAPAAWELVRMVTSILVAFDSLRLDHREALKMAQKYLDVYSATLTKGKAISIDPRTAQGIVQEFLNKVEKLKARELLKKHALSKKDEFKQLIVNDHHFALPYNLKAELTIHINELIKSGSYECYDFQVMDVVFRFAGTGSVGVKRYMFLLKSETRKNKYLLLDMKQSYPPSAMPYVQVEQSKWATEADRIINIQARMQNVSPALLGSTVFKGESFVLKQMQPTEDKINFGVIKGQYNDIDRVICDMATLTASSQLRSSGRQGSAIADELIAYGRSDHPAEWQSDLLAYARKYTGQVKKDYKEFITGYKKGLY